SYSPIVTIGGGTLLDVDPPRFKRKGPALVAHLELLQTGSPEVVLEEHIRHVGAGGVRLTTLSGRVPFGPERLRGLLEGLQEAGPPSAEEALGRAGVTGDEEHELFQVLVQSGKLVRVKDSLFFHAQALDSIQTKLVALLRERKEIGPSDIKDLLGISRKYAIPLLEFFDQRRVTARVGERRILRAG